MKFSIIKTAIIGLTVILLTGCAAKRNIPLQEAFWKNSNQKITVATVTPPTPQLHVSGQQGLLDMAITGMANSSLTKSIKNTDLKWYNEMPQNFIERLKQNKMLVAVYPKNLSNDEKSHINALTETNGDLLLILELKAIGARREYMVGFIPQSGPEGLCVLMGELVNPKDKKVLWRHEVEIVQKVQGKWDQPPHFPNFNTALNLAIAEAKQEVLDSFFSGR